MVIIDDVIQIDANSGLPTLETFNALDPVSYTHLKILFDSRDEINKHDYTLKHHVLCETEEYISWIGTCLLYTSRCV